MLIHDSSFLGGLQPLISAALYKLILQGNTDLAIGPPPFMGYPLNNPYYSLVTHSLIVSFGGIDTSSAS